MTAGEKRDLLELFHTLESEPSSPIIVMGVLLVVVHALLHDIKIDEDTRPVFVRGPKGIQ